MLHSIVHGEPTGRPPLVIAHGLFGSARNWGVIAKRLSDSRQVIAVDMRNHGDSPWAESHGYHDLAADLAEVMAPFDACDLLGHSMGGKAAMVLALTRPGPLRRLVVADIAPVAYGHSQQRLIEAMRGVDMDAVTLRSDAAAQLGELEPGVASFLLQSLDIRQKRWKLNLDVLAREMDRIVGFPEIDGRFEGPALFLSGEASDYVQPGHRDRIKALFPTARFARIPGAGHWLHAQEPRAFEATVRAFLDA